MTNSTEDQDRWWEQQWHARPLWMQPLMLFCIYMAVIYMPWDIFAKSVAEDQEVWFGYMLTGWAAKLTAPLHWAIYAAGAWGFWHMRRWMWPWAALYVAQIAIAMVVWSLLYRSEISLIGVAVIGGLFTLLAWALHRARRRFTT